VASPASVAVVCGGGAVGGGWGLRGEGRSSGTRTENGEKEIAGQGSGGWAGPLGCALAGRTQPG
jgi:hypothetical protein